MTGGGFDGGNPFAGTDDFGFERYFLPQSRMDLMVINEIEEGIGTAMCSTMIFVAGYIICGVQPFFEFLGGGISGGTHFPYIVSIWFLSMVVMTFQMCWFKCCGYEENTAELRAHNQQVQWAVSAPNLRCTGTLPLALHHSHMKDVRCYSDDMRCVYIQID